MAQDHDISDHDLPGSLFSLDAADNAEVIPTDLPRGPESMWSTQANPDEVDEVPPVRSALPPPPPGWSAGPPEWPPPREPDDADDEAWSRMGSSRPPGGPRFDVGSTADPSQRPPVPRTAVGAPGAGGVFSAEPVARDDDLLDEVEVVGELDEDWAEPVGGPAPVFSNGAGGPCVNGADRADGAPNPFSTSDADPWQAAAASPAGPPPFPGGVGADEQLADAVASDPHGYELAVARLHPEERERARVPLAVCGALLQPDEVVIGVVTGQMLGRPAAVVVSRTRVLVANDRRWIPIVDTYRVDEHLSVRGRHDRHVAALSFADREHFSMVDGITEVDLAIGLAEAIRHRGQDTTPPGGTEF